MFEKNRQFMIEVSNGRYWRIEYPVPYETEQRAREYIKNVRKIEHGMLYRIRVEECTVKFYNDGKSSDGYWHTIDYIYP